MATSSPNTTDNDGTAKRRVNTTGRQYYPFAAIVGQETLKLCLIMCAIDPTIGGVLIRGDKGTAKSTAARGLAHLLPQIEVGYDVHSGALDPYNRCPSCPTTTTADSHNHPNHNIDEDDLVHAAHAESRHIDTPFVDLPLGATEDRVLGSIDFSATLKHGGKPVFAPGLLAAANRGVLYVDEVNLLPAHLVDILLDAAAMGVNTVQREGMSKTHPAQFMLIGTMNQEEGDLRPQLLDRFGLMVDVEAPRDVALRTEVVRQRIAFERDGVNFRTRWQEAGNQLTQKIQAAKDILSEVVLADELLLLISRICCEVFQVGSLRADITLYKTAIALAAWRGRRMVEAEDIREAAEWVLAHRRRRQPFESPRDGPDTNEMMDELINNPPPPQPQPQEEQNQEQGEEHQQQPPDRSDDRQESVDDDTSSAGDNMPSSSKEQNQNNGRDEMETFTASKPGQIKQLKLGKQQQGKSGTGRRNVIKNTEQKTRYVRSMPTDKPVNLALDATLRAAAPNGLSESTGQPIILPNNWQKKVYNSTTDTLILFVVDASGSMSARKRMETVKGAVLALLTDAYQQRDRVGVIAFRGLKAELLLEPTRSVDLAEKQLQRLPTGGRTPLAHALNLTYNTIQRLRRHEPEQAILLIVLSDGKANVPLPDSQVGEDSWLQTEQVASQLAGLAIPTLMLDTDSGHVRVGRGKELGELLKADYLQLEELSADGLVHTIRQAVG